MKLLKAGFIIVLIIGLFAQAVYSQEAVASINQYYGALTRILYKSMDDPDRCVKYFRAFLSKNARWIDLIRKAREFQERETQYTKVIGGAEIDWKARGVTELEKYEGAFAIFAAEYPDQAAMIEKMRVHSILKSSTSLIN